MSKRPKCVDCGGTSDVHAAPLPDVIPGSHGGYQWLCGGCELLRANPDAAIAPRPRRHKATQAETLL